MKMAILCKLGIHRHTSFRKKTAYIKPTMFMFGKTTCDDCGRRLYASFGIKAFRDDPFPWVIIGQGGIIAEGRMAEEGPPPIDG